MLPAAVLSGREVVVVRGSSVDGRERERRCGSAVRARGRRREESKVDLPEPGGPCWRHGRIGRVEWEGCESQSMQQNED